MGVVGRPSLTGKPVFRAASTMTEATADKKDGRVPVTMLSGFLGAGAF